MLERVRTMGAREHRSVLSLEQNAIRYTIPYVKLELALPLSLLKRYSSETCILVLPCHVYMKTYPEHKIYGAGSCT